MKTLRWKLLDQGSAKAPKHRCHWGRKTQNTSYMEMGEMGCSLMTLLWIYFGLSWFAMVCLFASWETSKIVAWDNHVSIIGQERGHPRFSDKAIFLQVSTATSCISCPCLVASLAGRCRGAWKNQCLIALKRYLHSLQIHKTHSMGMTCAIGLWAPASWMPEGSKVIYEFGMFACCLCLPWHFVIPHGYSFLIKN